MEGGIHSLKKAAVRQVCHARHYNTKEREMVSSIEGTRIYW